jgi:hypothetical protein
MVHASRALDLMLNDTLTLKIHVPVFVPLSVLFKLQLAHQ